MPFAPTADDRRGEWHSPNPIFLQIPKSYGLGVCHLESFLSKNGVLCWVLGRLPVTAKQIDLLH
jgi:hypothetical protein